MAESSVQNLKRRFADNSIENIDELLKIKVAKKTLQSTETCMRIFHAYCDEKDIDLANTVCGQELCDILVGFYASVKNRSGDDYKASTLRTIRFSLARYYKDTYSIDIITDPIYTKANDVYFGKLKQLKTMGLGGTMHKEEVEPEDLKLLYASLNTDSAVGLQQKVWTDIMLYLIRRGRENVHIMTKNTFGEFKDGTGHTYIAQIRDELDKNHQNFGDDSIGQGTMYEIEGSSICPVRSYRKYISKLSPKTEHLWQRACDGYSTDDPIWYVSSRLGEKSLGSMMSKMSEQYKLSKRYTNHCLRSTSISILDASGIEGRQIIRTSGHKNEASIKSYSRNLTSAKKREISSTLSRAMSSENQENKEPDVIINEVNFEDDTSDELLLSIPNVLPDVNPLANDYFLLPEQVSVNSVDQSILHNISVSNGDPLVTEKSVEYSSGSDKNNGRIVKNMGAQNETDNTVSSASQNVVYNFSPRNTNTLMRAINISKSVVNIYYQSSSK